MITVSVLLFLGVQASALPSTSNEARAVDVATRLFQLEHNAKAVEVLEQFLKSNPHSYKASLFLAFGLIRDEKYSQSLNMLQTLIRREPRDYYAHHVQGLAFVGLNRATEAATSFKKAIALRGDFAESHFQLGLLLAKSADNLEQAYDTLRRALELGQEPSAVQRQLGSVAIKQGRLDTAIEHLRAAAEIRPDSSETWFQLADALRKSGQATEAKNALDRFTSLKSAAEEQKAKDTQAQALYQHGMQLLSSGSDLDGAFEKFRQAVDLSSANDPALYRLAQIQYLRGQLPAAQNSITRAIELNPFEAEYYFVQARCLESTNSADATEAIQKALELNDRVGDFHNLLGNLLSRQGDSTGALRSYQTAVKLEPGNDAFVMNLRAAQAKARGR